VNGWDALVFLAMIALAAYALAWLSSRK